jgi:transcriptional regulator with XRE-family HTH domain
MRRPRFSRSSSSSNGESFGARLARLRKERGFTQVELAEKVGMIQALISDYELDKLRPYADVAARFAEALGISTDELLGVSRPQKSNGVPGDRRFLRRLQLIGKLPKRDQDALLRTIDAFLDRGAAR